RFLVPVDFSEDANQAVQYAIDLANKLGARLTLLHVIQLLPLGSGDRSVTVPYTYFQELEADLTSRMQAYLERVTAAGLEGEMAVAPGVPFQKILKRPKAQQVNLFIRGTKGRPGLQHMLMGGVAKKVVRRAPCRVLVVREPTIVPISKGTAIGCLRAF